MKPLPFSAEDHAKLVEEISEVGVTSEVKKWLDNQPDPEELVMSVDPEGQKYVDAVFGSEEELAIKAIALGADDLLLAMETKGVTITPGGRVGDDSSHNFSPKENWVDKRGGLPRYIKIVRNGLIREGHSEGRATALAVAAIKRWAVGGNNVSAKVQAAAAKALAEWEAMKASKGLEDSIDLEVKMRTMEDREGTNPKKPDWSGSKKPVHKKPATRKVAAKKRATTGPAAKNKKPLGKKTSGGSGKTGGSGKSSSDFESKHPRDQFGKFVAISRGDGTGKDNGKDPKKTKQIKDIQKALIDGGYLDANSGDGNKSGVDGAFGPKTEAAVKKWQKENGMKPDGLLSSEMVTKITATAGKKKATTTTATKKVGAKKIAATKKPKGPATASVRKLVQERRKRMEDHQKRLEDLMISLEQGANQR